ncbi:ABC transporter permease [Peteryoungia desertarenae]|uniref:ABC transporter permease n=1 Tax=Peteryoungia desertarenae TaxID=1813451 RepID=A0ABX6QKW5_9HYPH|nr:ABC transporter permease [Peteryoungia desertarenae]QLF68912.1 ABC transporter permease [Peteryoungia desertarenae]
MSAILDLPPSAPERRADGHRIRTLFLAIIAFSALVAVLVSTHLYGRYGIDANFATRLLGPSWIHPAGTDQLGRDMFARTLHGLALSFWVGLIASSLSVIIAILLALVATTCGRLADEAVSFLVDAAMGLPHFVLLILISFSLGGGTTAVIIAVAVTHWPRLTRILRAELLQLREAEFVRASRQFGKSWFYIGRHHFLPHLVPQLLVGLVLLFPHAILHEAGLTFIGFGLEPSKPAIGVLLSDSMRYLTAGKWWLGLFPGLALLMVVLCFDAIGNGLRLLTDPRQEQT